MISDERLLEILKTGTPETVELVKEVIRLRCLLCRVRKHNKIFEQATSNTNMNN